jgi:parallel beta-helix repeat protein
VSVDFAGAVIRTGSVPPAWAIEIRGAHNVAVLNAEIAGGANGILVDASTDVSVVGNELHDLSQNGIVVSGGSHAAIRSNRLHGLQRSGIVLHGDVTQSLLEGNEIHDLTGYSNWHAGILITGRSRDIAADPAAFNAYGVAGEPIVHRLRNPTRNVVVGNDIRDSRSSGIYNDGGIANVLVDNDVVGNAKEGLCLDNGSTANVVAGNTVTDNGNRWGQPDEVLAIDSVLDEGRAPDGTAIAKLPGISLDNALYNEVHANTVARNFGGGIKMVRTSFFNVISGNVLTDNNLGQSNRFHYFGIELGAAVPDFADPDLDYVGSSGNVVVGNQIHGNHHSGVYVAAASVQNEIIGNDIDGVTAFEIERPP